MTVPVASPSTATRSLTIVGLGDSHTNGQIEAAATAGGNLTTSSVGGARDSVWAGTALSAYFRFDSQINSANTPTASNDQSNSAVSTGSGSYLGLLPQALRAGNPRVGAVTIANLGIGGSATYTWAGEPAQAYIGYVGTPGDGDTVTVAGRAYRFKTVPAQAYDVQIGVTTASLTNLMNAINAESTGWFAGTAANTNCYAPNTPQASTYLHVNALQVGTAGNALVISASNQAGITSMNNGLTAVASQTMSGGSATSALWSNGKAALNGGSTIGRVDAFVITLGPNDANRVGYRGRNTAADYTTLITNIQTDYPGVPIVVVLPSAISTTATAITAYNGAVATAVRALTSISGVYLVDQLTLGAGSGNVLIGPRADGLHCTNYGYAVMAQMVAAKLTTVLGLAA